jgi:hypothetical protein
MQIDHRQRMWVTRACSSHELAGLRQFRTELGVVRYQIDVTLSGGNVELLEEL